MQETYDRIGLGYGGERRSDPRWAVAIDAALGDARRVVNVGAGTGSYEPGHRDVTAVEPSATMVAQRPSGSAPVIRASAEALPLANGAFDVALAVLTTHHWPDVAAGIAEMRRVAARQVVVTWDPLWFEREFWLLRDYLPEIGVHDRALPTLDAVLAHLPGAQVSALPVPHDCVDGFLGAYWRRPAAYLDQRVRASMSGFALLPPAVVARGLDRLRQDLASGDWQRANAALLDLEAFDLGYRLVVADT